LVRTPLAFRYVPTESVSSASANDATFGAAVFRGASAPGGPVGSVALASPPCSTAAVGGPSRGVGQVQLRGGVTTPTFTCPIDQNPIGSYATAATTWAVTGFAAGRLDPGRRRLARGRHTAQLAESGAVASTISVRLRPRPRETDQRQDGQRHVNRFHR
jgi:hypothetical protein